MKNQMNFFEFLCRRIDNQIKKYKRLRLLATDAEGYFNASLVSREVNELLELAYQLLGHIISSSKDDKIFKSIFDQTLFYVQQENFRATADYLVDPCIMKENLRSQIDEQLGQLKELAQSTSVSISKPIDPKTLTQHQCQYGNISIAASVLNSAIQYRNFPKDQPSHIDNETHAVLEDYAIEWYKDNHSKISKMHTYCIDFLTRFSSLKRSTQIVGKEDYQGKLDKLIEIYRTLNPKFNLKRSLPDKHMFFGTIPLGGKNEGLSPLSKL